MGQPLKSDDGVSKVIIAVMWIVMLTCFGVAIAKKFAGQ